MGKGKKYYKLRGREANHKRLLNTENKLSVDRGVGERGKSVMDTCRDEHWVLYVSDEPWESTPKTKSTLNTLYVSQFDNKLYLKKLIKKKKKNCCSHPTFSSHDPDLSAANNLEARPSTSKMITIC